MVYVRVDHPSSIIDHPSPLATHENQAVVTVTDGGGLDRLDRQTEWLTA